MTQHIIFGAGALGRELYWFLGLHVAGSDTIFVDDAAQPEQKVYGNPVVDRLRTEPKPFAQVYVAISDPFARHRVADAIRATGLRPSYYQHKTATRVMGRNQVDDAMLMPYSLISCGCSIGPGLFLNAYASVGHDCEIGAYCTLGPYAGITGGVTLGDYVTLGAGAMVLPGVKIGDGAFIGAGSLVLRDVEAGARVFGNPAKVTGHAK